MQVLYKCILGWGGRGSDQSCLSCLCGKKTRQRKDKNNINNDNKDNNTNKLNIDMDDVIHERGPEVSVYTNMYMMLNNPKQKRRGDKQAEN